MLSTCHNLPDACFEVGKHDGDHKLQHAQRIAYCRPFLGVGLVIHMATWPEVFSANRWLHSAAANCLDLTASVLGLYTVCKMRPYLEHEELAIKMASQYDRRHFLSCIEDWCPGLLPVLCC